MAARSDADAIGVLMLNTSFRRFVGDIGNSLTWDFPVRYRIVEDARASRVVRAEPADLLEAFKKAADELVAEGVIGLATSCGFLSVYQRALADHCRVPVATSSLLQAASIERMLPSGRRVGVLTYDAASLTRTHLEAVGAAPDTPVVGMGPQSRFARWIREDDASPDFAALGAEVVAAAERLKARHPDVGAILCECTNMAPFSALIGDRLGLPVFDVVTLVNWFHAGLRPNRFRNARVN